MKKRNGKIIKRLLQWKKRKRNKMIIVMQTKENESLSIPNVIGSHSHSKRTFLVGRCKIKHKMIIADRLGP
jgi:hypothetical protein